MSSSTDTSTPAPPGGRRRRRLATAAAAVLVVAGAALAAVLLFVGDGAKESAAQTDRPVERAEALVSRPDLRPPGIDVIETSDETEPGLMFIGPKKVFGAKKVEGEQQGPMIVDDQGRIRWFHPMPENLEAYDVRVQRYRGEPVVTWWEGNAVRGSGNGVGMIYDTNYRRIAKVETGTGADADIHEFLITPEDTALMILYRSQPYDLRPVGGKREDKIVEGIVREVDIETGEVLFEWRGLDHLDITESHENIEKRYGDSWDYLHLNSIDIDTDGNLLLSARHTWAVYKIDRETGELIWRLGGKRSDFDLTQDEQFSWQHDARAEGPGVVRIFDNAAASDPVRPESRVVTYRLDREAGDAELIEEIEHPEAISSGTQANAQLLPGGHVFVGWGSKGHFSEFDEDGEMLFDARVERGYDSYRAYRSPWTATPTDWPAIAAEREGAEVVVHASWNGSTEVQAWQVVAGDGPTDLEPVGDPFGWEDLETRIEVETDAPYVAVRALDERGRVLATSSAQQVGDGSGA